MQKKILPAQNNFATKRKCFFGVKSRDWKPRSDGSWLAKLFFTS